MAIIDDPSVYWQMKQWTGNDGTSALTFDGNADLQADLFWLKTRNAGDLVDKLTINYNRSRQASITKELIEIISGAESL